MVSFSVRMVDKRVRDWSSGRGLPVQNVVEYPPPPPLFPGPWRNTADNLHVLLSTVFYNCIAFRIFKSMEYTDSFGQF